MAINPSLLRDLLAEYHSPLGAAGNLQLLQARRPAAPSGLGGHGSLPPVESNLDETLLDQVVDQDETMIVGVFGALVHMVRHLTGHLAF